ncbi:MAG: hypothetical protein BEN19_01355 [Epulopiscium sp. Nuni2H_MBin003]|nr:MAG: hypothetical protein BEN19_01355 [Epulopiscium sp. Nuni2H_MBin003]
MKNVVIGMILGIANVIPGVSAGTMAVVFKIYDQLLNSISLDIKKINFKFLATIGIGVILGVLLFSNVITFLYENYNMQTNFVFIGVILGSIPMIYKKVSDAGPVNLSGIVIFVIPLVIMLYMAIAGEGQGSEKVIENITISTGILLIIAGAVSAFTMIIPGISGSFILLTIGCYETIVKAISDVSKLGVDFIKSDVSFVEIITFSGVHVLILVAIGVFIGLIGGSKLVRMLLEDYPQATYLVILGLVVGSIFTIYPGFSLDATGIISIVCMIVALIVSYMFAEN